MQEIDKILERYKKRDVLSHRYSFLRPSYYKNEQEKERAIINWINKCNITPLEEKKLLEIGCGSGVNILTFIKLGFNPKNITANELIEQRLQKAKTNLSSDVTFLQGNALDLEIKDESFDVVFQAMVFTSIFDEDFRKQLAQKMWRWTKPGGGILWYDFIYNNPQNKDVRKVSYSEVKKLFPDAKITKWKITLAPPLSRIVTKLHPFMHDLFSIFPFFRTHLLLWIQKK